MLDGETGFLPLNDREGRIYSSACSLKVLEAKENRSKNVSINSISLALFLGSITYPFTSITQDEKKIKDLKAEV